jgi:hypothetical protein
MKVVGYSYDADTHCVDCTRKYAEQNASLDEMFKEFYPSSVDIDRLIETMSDSEGNPLHPIFEIDEAGDCPTHCGDCGVFIDDSWNGDTMNYAACAIEAYVVNHEGNAEVLDVWAENLRWCIGADEHLLDRYRKLRERENG